MAYTAAMSVFAGISDLEWEIPESCVRELIQYWESAPLSNTPPASSPEMIYRGCAFFDGSGQWRAFRGIISHTFNGQTSYRQDTCRRFEKMLLVSSTPEMAPLVEAVTDEEEGW